MTRPGEINLVQPDIIRNKTRKNRDEEGAHTYVFSGCDGIKSMPNYETEEKKTRKRRSLFETLIPETVSLHSEAAVNVSLVKVFNVGRVSDEPLQRSAYTTSSL